MQALLITPDFPPALGGIQRLTHRLVSHLEQVRCRVVTLGAPSATAWDEGQDLDIRRAPEGRDRRVGIVRLNAAALAEARRFRPDVVLVMHIVAAPAAAVIRRLLGVPVVTYLHGLEVRARPRIAAMAVRSSDRIVAVSRYTAGLAAGVGAEQGRISIVPPGVDWRDPPHGDRFATPTVTTVARLENRYKGHDVVMRAMPLVRARVPGVEWVIVGDGSLRGEIERLAAMHGVRDAVRFCGAVADEERDRWLDGAHVFAMPSRLPAGGGAGEGFGIAYLEAGVHGLPVVAGSVGGALDAVVHGSTGLLVDPTDHVEVADAIARLLLDRASAAQMGHAGSDHAREFAWPRIASTVADLLADTVNGP
jgi:phosphatidylinositol alpha-1,6-mannosyltransferase